MAFAVAGLATFGLLGIGPRTGAYRTLTVLSGSMRPTFDPGSVVVVRPFDLREVRTGDVIAFTAPIDGRPTVTHRVIEVVEPGPNPVVRTQGDANDVADPWAARLSGGGWRVVGAVPVVGRATNVLTRPEVRRAVNVVLPAAFLVVWMAALLPERRRKQPAAPAGEGGPRAGAPAGEGGAGAGADGRRGLGAGADGARGAGILAVPPGTRRSGGGWEVVGAMAAIGRATDVSTRPEVRRVVNVAVPAALLVVGMGGLLSERRTRTHRWTWAARRGARP